MRGQQDTLKKSNIRRTHLYRPKLPVAPARPTKAIAERELKARGGVAWCDVQAQQGVLQGLPKTAGTSPAAHTAIP